MTLEPGRKRCAVSFMDDPLSCGRRRQAGGIVSVPGLLSATHPLFQDDLDPSWGLRRQSPAPALDGRCIAATLSASFVPPAREAVKTVPMPVPRMDIAARRMGTGLTGIGRVDRLKARTSRLGTNCTHSRRADLRDTIRESCAGGVPARGSNLYHHNGGAVFRAARTAAPEPRFWRSFFPPRRL